MENSFKQYNFMELKCYEGIKFKKLVIYITKKKVFSVV